MNSLHTFKLLVHLICLNLIPSVFSNDSETSKEWFKIEGKVQAPDHWAKSYGDWKLNTHILIDGGEYRAYLKYLFVFSLIFFIVYVMFYCIQG